MSEIHVNIAALPGIADGLDSAADGIEGLSSGVPSGVDAGPMTPVVSAMLAQVVDSAGNVSTSAGAAADAVRRAHTYYQRTDADVGASMAEIEAAVP